MAERKTQQKRVVAPGAYIGGTGEIKYEPSTRPKDISIEMWEKGEISDCEHKFDMIEWNKTSDGRKFHYECPECGQPMRCCPDPSCREDAVGHHLFSDDDAKCSLNDIPYKNARRVWEDGTVEWTE